MRNEITTFEQLSDFSESFLKRFPRGGVFGLIGDLGTGKTTFVRNVITHLMPAGNHKPIRVASPTFVIHQSYPEIHPPIEHYDLYRLQIQSEEDLLKIGYDQSLALVQNCGAYVFVEWPEKCSQIEWLQLTAKLTFELEPGKEGCFPLRVVQVL